MRIEEVRTSFTVYLIASDMARFDGIAESLRLAGYLAASFEELTAAFSEFPSNPPHFLLFDSQENQFNLKKAIKQVSVQLPESHIFLVAPVEGREHAVPLFEYGVYDIIYTPLISQMELLRPLDRAAERDYFMYMNERLTQSEEPSASEPTPFADVEGQPPPLPGPARRSAETVQTSASIYIGERTHVLNKSSAAPLTTVAPVIYPAAPEARITVEDARGLFAQKTVDECVSVFLKVAATFLGSCPAVYFKYFQNRRVLMAAQSHRLEGVDIGGIGVNFNDLKGPFRTSHLRDPQGIEELGQMVREMFSVQDFLALPVFALGEVQGVAVFLRADPPPEQRYILNDWLTLLNKSVELLESEKRLHVVAVKDPHTDLFNRQNFVVKVQHEVSRARRTMLPVSLALIAVDQYDQIVGQIGQEEAQTVMRMVARIFEKHSRVNDVLGRTGADEFGLILPHTGKQGALIKVERLRRIVQSADFSKVLSAFPHLTVTVGVSEYPSFVRDAEELQASADEALFQVRKLGNKTCVAKAPEGFSPDFLVTDRDKK